MIAVVLAGGQGTRLRSVSGDTPKALVDVGGKTVLERQLDSFAHAGVKKVLLMLGYQAERIMQRYPSLEHRGMRLEFHAEEAPLGTAGGLYALGDPIDEDFLLSNGDIVFDLDFERLREFHRRTGSLCTLVAHPNDHPHDSDVLLLDDGEAERVSGILSKHRVRTAPHRNLVSAGIMLASPRVLDFEFPSGRLDFEKDVLPRAIEKGGVYAYRTTEYIKDMGTPERLDEVRRAVANGKVERRKLSNRQRAVFLDRDGTINELRGLISRKDEIVLLPGAAEAVADLNRSDFLVIVVTNQPVVARNMCSEHQLREIHDKLESDLGEARAYIDELLYCPHHPDKGYPEENPAYKMECSCRKPKTGLIDRACALYNIDPSLSYMIGDSTTDIETAARAGLKSVLVLTGEGGQDGKFDIRPTHVADNLRDAVRLVLKEDREH